MTPEPRETEKNLIEDLKTFEELPVKTRELQLLADEAEKTTGKNREDLDGKIGQQSRRAISGYQRDPSCAEGRPAKQ